MNEWSYLYTFIQSNLLEIPIFLYFYMKLRSQHRGRPLLIVSFANSLTHPLVFFGFMGWGWSYLTSILWAEAFAIVSETVLHSYFGRLPLSQAFHASLLANFFSWQVAPIVTFWVVF